MKKTFVLLSALWAADAHAQTAACDEPNVLVILDVSGSMGRANKNPPSKYDQAVAAIHQVTQNTESDIRYGLMVFPEPGTSPVYCGDADVPVNVPFALDNWDPIYRFISPTLYGSSTANPEFFGGPRSDYDTPMVQALRSAMDVDELMSPDRRQFVLFISDGAQDCSRGGDYDAEPDANPGVAYGQPGYWVEAEYEENRTDAVVAVDDLWYAGVRTFVVGFGLGADPITLNELAVWGGTADWDCTDDCYFQADNGGELVTALQSIAQLVQVEICNGVDDDCDGAVDEGTDRLCETDCGSGFEVCENGQYLDCDARKPSTDVCNGEDDNCDGNIDETCSCTNGTSRSCGTNTGDCIAGTQHCSGGTWGACQATIGPAPEICEGSHDEDCDGLTDEGCACVEGEERSCGSADGPCEPGVQTCEDGEWGPCEGDIPPSSTETCDGTDNDCDGETDEHCDCANGETRACGSSHGSCEPGQQTCEDGEWSTCVGDVPPASGETCDNIDNDCNGEIDDDVTCGSTLSCRCGACVGPCGSGDSCPSGATCMDGFCIEDNSCPDGMTCDGRYCDDGGTMGTGDDDDGGGNGNQKPRGVERGGCGCAESGPKHLDLAFLVLLLVGGRLYFRRAQWID